MIDIHNHSLFGVDDGAKDLKMSLAMLKQAIAVGIKKVYLTPHVNGSAQRADRATHIKHFEILKEAAKDLPIELELWAEIYIGQSLPKLKWEDYVVHKNYLLVEFSPVIEAPIMDLCYNLTKKGYRVVLAHVERYGYLTLEDLYELKDIGVIIQVNASSILQKGQWFHSFRAKKYNKLELIDIVASDAHDDKKRKLILTEKINIHFNNIKCIFIDFI
jgi:protein-tyrosine phosphatase